MTLCVVKTRDGKELGKKREEFKRDQVYLLLRAVQGKFMQNPNPAVVLMSQMHIQMNRQQRFYKVFCVVCPFKPFYIQNRIPK